MYSSSFADCAAFCWLPEDGGGGWPAATDDWLPPVNERRVPPPLVEDGWGGQFSSIRESSIILWEMKRGLCGAFLEELNSIKKGF
jgi:hypothetical protein